MRLFAPQSHELDLDHSAKVLWGTCKDLFLQLKSQVTKLKLKVS